MKKFLLIFLLVSAFVARPQSNTAVTSLDSFPQESISMHVNTTVFLTGESLLFSVYCFDDQTKEKLSDFSRIAYVELIDNKQRPVSQMKVKLDHGTGSGDYYFDSRIPSGNYTLIAYTRWMRNFGPQSFYRQTITVVNADQLQSTAKSSNTSQKVLPPPSESASSIKIALDKKQYNQREKITLKIIPEEGAEIQFSVNVRLLESRPDFNNVNQSQEDRSLRQSEIKFLPDLRGELVTGAIKNKATGKSLKNELVTLSSPSGNSGFLLSRTDSAGRFYFNVNDFQSSFMLLKPLNALADEFNITVDDGFCEEHIEFAPPEFKPDSAFLKSLTRRYLSAQIENAFYEVKKDSVLKASSDKLFTPDKVFRLDDFTRFPTMEDVFREIVPEVIVKAKQGEFSLSIRNNETGDRFYNTPLTLIDGIPVSSTELMNYNPLLVKRISVVNRRYYLGGLETEGIISIETYKGVAENINTSHMQRITYTAPLPDKLYYSPAYDTNSNLTRIPDYRTQLYWNSGAKASASTSLTFFASDVSGEYIVEVVGVKNNGEKISAVQKITVAK